MSTSNEFHTEFKSIEAIRDELALQAHLMKAEAKQEWEEIDKRWQSAQNELRRVVKIADESRQEISTNFKTLLKSFSHGFQQIRRSL